jgi:hypothetical protein
MDKLNIVQSVKESPLSRQLSEDELFVLISRLANPKKDIATMTGARILRHRLLHWVQTGKWLMTT